MGRYQLELNELIVLSNETFILFLKEEMLDKILTMKHVKIKWEEAIDRNVPVNNSLLTGTFWSINPY